MGKKLQSIKKVFKDVPDAHGRLLWWIGLPTLGAAMMAWLSANVWWWFWPWFGWPGLIWLTMAAVFLVSVPMFVYELSNYRKHGRTIEGAIEAFSGALNYYLTMTAACTDDGKRYPARMSYDVLVENFLASLQRAKIPVPDLINCTPEQNYMILMAYHIDVLPYLSNHDLKRARVRAAELLKDHGIPKAPRWRKRLRSKVATPSPPKPQDTE